jgi:adenylylsulfate kinase
MANISSNVVWHEATVQRAQREAQNGHKSGILWFTGLSGAGKSTLAHAVEQRLHAQGVRTYVLDGDNVRHGLCGDLGFSEADRRENIRRIGEMAKLFVDAGIVVLTAFISPFRVDRDRVRSWMAPGDFLEIHCRCTVEICEQRDVKGLYKKARAGGVKDFTGISSPYEEPLAPELAVDTGTLELEQCVSLVLALLRARGMLPQNVEPVR